jgi:hypothetical protein
MALTLAILLLVPAQKFTKSHTGSESDAAGCSYATEGSLGSNLSSVIGYSRTRTPVAL